MSLSQPTRSSAAVEFVLVLALCATGQSALAQTDAGAAPAPADVSEGPVEAEAVAETPSAPGADPEPSPEPAADLAGQGAVAPAGASEGELAAGSDPSIAGVAAGAPTSDEIVVSARRREEGLQSTPVAVSAFTARDLEQRNVDSADDLAQFTPNLQLEGAAALSGSSSNATVFIRGIGQNDFAIFSDPGVGLYVDDVYLGRSIGGVLDVVDVRRVEVLRGPQGTLFGRNTIGGAVLVTSQRPTFEPEGTVELTTGRFYRADFRTVLNAPLIDDTLAVRIAATRLGRDGYARRLVDDGQLGDIDRVAGRAQLLWTPSDELEVLVSADATRAREHSAPSTLVAVTPGGYPFQNIFNTLVAPDAGITTPSNKVDAAFITGDPFTTYATGPNRSDLDSWGVSLTPTWEVHPEVSLKSITAYRDLHAVFGRDGDNTPFAFRETFNDDDQWQLSQELQVFGDSFDDRLSWLLGGYYFHEEAHEDAIARLAEGVFAELEALPGPQAFPPAPPMVMPTFGGMGNPANRGADLVIDLDNEVKNRSFAGFAHASFEIIEPLKITAGIRLTHEIKDFALVHRRIASDVEVVGPNDAAADLPYEFSDPFTSVDPKAGLELQALGNVLAYFTWSRGFKSGGRNGRPLVSAMEVTKYEPETLYSYELGIKTDWLERALVANLAVFYYDYRDIQLTVNQTPANFVANAARAALLGGELELRANPVRVFQLDATLGLLDAEYEEVGEGLMMGQMLPITEESKLPKAPAFTASGGAQYTLELGEAAGALRLRADIAYRSKVYHDVANNPLLAQDGFALVASRLSWVTDEEDWEVALFITNLTDERYRISGNAASPAFGVAESAYGRPREWGATLAHRF